MNDEAEATLYRAVPFYIAATPRGEGVSRVERKEREAAACPNCGGDLRYKLSNGHTARTGHFVPPSCGEPGFWICKTGGNDNG